ncbi:adenylosuccinate lyase [Candidatus Levibacter sp. Uisw_134_01]|uniref:adenylosuccinate lyase n=1 Tax=Candidatus Levibacter sp. Uisw_134_01 TaxID=3230999 RepID=UPI003D44558A
MIERYSRKQMVDIWSQQEKFNIWFQIEAHACDAQAKLGVIPKDSAKIIWEKGQFDIDSIDEIEKTTKHDVIAFLTNLTEYIGEDARFIHQGMTSSDVLDTTLSIQLQKASDILLNDLDLLLKAIEKRSIEHKNTVTIGRSHAIHAEPITFGLKLASYYAEFKRNKKRLLDARKEISTCAISGAVGTFAHIDPYVENYVSQKLDLIPEEISTQIIPRDRHAMFFSILGVIASSVERLATEIRHLQRTEVREVEEFFSQGQKGSSAMPHKRNPVLTENLTGLARLVRSSVIPALENVTLWHERDISHSSVERMIAPDATITLDFALHRLTNVIENLLIYPNTMQLNLEKLGGLVHSQQVLLALTQKGASRESAYEMVQSNAMKVWETPEHERKNVYKKLLIDDQNVRKFLDEAEIEKLFNLEQHFVHVDTIFQRVFSK